MAPVLAEMQCYVSLKKFPNELVAQVLSYTTAVKV
jgi:hypothetical protein